MCIYIYIYINRKISIEFTCVGLASAGPNNQNFSRRKRGSILLFCAPNRKLHASGIKEDEKLLIDLKWP